MGSKGRREYLRVICERYRRAGRKTQKVILSEFCSNTGYHRKYAIRLLNGPPPEKQRTPRQRRRGLTYHQEALVSFDRGVVGGAAEGIVTTPQTALFAAANFPQPQQQTLGYTSDVLTTCLAGASGKSA